ncbi:glycerol-3-phosphate responsive antiterminator [Pseudogracilibacillus auburnensis]|uniref:glycerol-3-phosphate responsive antiterminator n=1 Tax=Pseudogracilibacillus auburnensis TaxID=1494959 RepID=UPI001A95E271|nr:glycerol-3-phosphate responsive antiterminator [Pseudogracilibacillus auburnensis]MBO1004204.1 glycerol-3-phosphate responsive antiterminator [Pseudogracilibacillus auburnensis]
MSEIVDIVQSQIIASVKKEEDIDIAIQSNANIIFLLTGDLITTKNYVKRLREANKEVFIHIDFIDGLANSKSTIEYVAQKWEPRGIITTKSNLIQHAKKAGLLTVQRMFLIDRNALSRGLEIAHRFKPDAIEVLPGIMPSIIDELTKLTPLPIIAGGLVSNETEILHGLEAGALAISAGSRKLWNVDV